MKMDDPEMRSVRLLKLECSKFFLLLPPIATLTYYRGDSPENYLRQRVQEILLANPWLAGSLLTEKDGIRLQYSVRPTKQCFFVERSYSTIPFPENDNAPYDILNAGVQSLLPKPASDILDNDKELLFKVVLLCIDEEKFAVLCALNHAVGDGHTFYTIHRMLSEDADAVAMTVDRNEEALSYSEQYPLVMGAYGRSWSFFTNAIVSALKNVFFKSLVSSVSQIKLTAINTIKQRWTHCTLPISTNDIITSAFFRATRCDIGLMAMNLRSRVPDLTENHAGNYETVLTMWLKHYESPEAVRKAVDAVNKRTINPTTFPGFWRTLFTKFTVATNWSTFYRDVVFKNCDLIRHHPVVDFTTGSFETCCVFRPKADKLAILFTTMRGKSAREVCLSQIDC